MEPGEIVTAKTRRGRSRPAQKGDRCAACPGPADGTAAQEGGGAESARAARPPGHRTRPAPRFCSCPEVLAWSAVRARRVQRPRLTRRGRADKVLSFFGGAVGSPAASRSAGEGTRTSSRSTQVLRSGSEADIGAAKDKPCEALRLRGWTTVAAAGKRYVENANLRARRRPSSRAAPGP